METIEYRSPHIYRQLIEGKATAEEYVAAVKVEVAAQFASNRHTELQTDLVRCQDNLGMIAAAALRTEGKEVKGWQPEDSTKVR